MTGFTDSFLIFRLYKATYFANQSNYTKKFLHLAYYFDYYIVYSTILAFFIKTLLFFSIYTNFDIFSHS